MITAIFVLFLLCIFWGYKVGADMNGVFVNVPGKDSFNFSLLTVLIYPLIGCVFAFGGSM